MTNQGSYIFSLLQETPYTPNKNEIELIDTGVNTAACFPYNGSKLFVKANTFRHHSAESFVTEQLVLSALSDSHLCPDLVYCETETEDAITIMEYISNSGNPQVTESFAYETGKLYARFFKETPTVETGSISVSSYSNQHPEYKIERRSYGDLLRAQFEDELVYINNSHIEKASKEVFSKIEKHISDVYLKEFTTGFVNADCWKRNVLVDSDNSPTHLIDFQTVISGCATHQQTLLSEYLSHTFEAEDTDVDAKNIRNSVRDGFYEVCSRPSHSYTGEIQKIVRLIFYVFKLKAHRLWYDTYEKQKTHEEHAKQKILELNTNL